MPSKKILSLIAEKEATGSEIANELNLPLNTVGYNIDKLLKAGLIETSKNFFWSLKGKKMPTYKISNKKVIKAFDLMREVLIENHAKRNKILTKIGE